MQILPATQGQTLGMDVFDCDNISDSNAACNGASTNDQCVGIIWAKAGKGSQRCLGLGFQQQTVFHKEHHG